MATTPAMMNAARIDRFGGPEVLSLVDVAVPRPGAGEVLLKVLAASVNPVDWKIRAGKYPAVRDQDLPYTLGRDVSGDVVAVGAGASFSEGTALYAFLGVDRGGYAEYVLVRDGEAASKPSTLDHTTAAAVPLAGLTAWQGLFRHGGLQAGQRVLIHAGSGGVGHFAVQFAKAKGAYVITTVSAQNIDFARSLGADEVIDHDRARFEEQARDVDLVFDLIGGETQERSWATLKKGGILVSTISAPPPGRAEALGVRGARFTAEPSAAELGEIGALIDAGKVKPVVSRTFALQDVVAALKAVESGHTVGKVVLTTEDRGSAQRDAAASSQPLANALFAFDDRDSADRAAQRLRDEGLKPEAIRLHSRENGPVSDGSAAVDEQVTGGLVTNLLSLFQGIFEWGSSPHDASAYEETIRTGGAVLSVDTTTDAEREKVDRAMKSAGAARRTDWSAATFR